MLRCAVLRHAVLYMSSAVLLSAMLHCCVHDLCCAALCCAVLSSGGTCRQTSEGRRAGSAGLYSRKRDAPGPNLAIDQQELQGDSTELLAIKHYGITVTEKTITWTAKVM